MFPIRLTGHGTIKCFANYYFNGNGFAGMAVILYYHTKQISFNLSYQ